MHLGLATSLVLHASLLMWGLFTIKATPPFKLPDTPPIEVSIISEIGLENLQRKGDTSAKNLDAAGKDGSAMKEPPKKDVKAPPPPPPAPPPPAVAEAPPPPPPEPPKPTVDEVAALIEKEPPPPKPEPPKPPEVKVEPPKPTPDDQAALQKKLEEAEKAAADEARRKAEAEAKAKADAEARAKELERQKKLAEAREKKRIEDLAKKKIADAAKAKAEADAKAKQFNPDAIAKAIDGAADDGKQQILKDNRKPAPAQPAGQKSDTASKNRGPVAGSADGNSDKLTATQLALFGQIMRSSVITCMNINAGAEGMERLPPFEIEVRLKPDGQLAAPPKLVSTGSGPLFYDATSSAMRALIQCAPYTNLPPNLYTGGWDHMIVPFDIAKMYRR